MSEPAEPPSQPGDPADGTGTELVPRRLHPAGAVLSALDDIRNAVFSLVVLLVLGSRSGDFGAFVVLIGLAGAALAAAVGYARWRAETYEIADGAIRHRQGIVSPDEAVIPLARVHSIDTSQGLVQRLFGVYELHVQTAGGGEKGEIVLRAVSPAETAILRAAAGLPEPTTAELPEWRLSPRGLLLVGLTAPQLGMLLPLVGAAFAVGNDLLGRQDAQQTLIDRAPTETGAIVLLVVAALAGAWLLSFLGSLVAFAGFSVVRDGDHLRVHRGFLQRRATSIPLRRIHAVSIAEGPLRRPFGLCSVRLETAGYGREPAAARTLFPLLAVGAVDAELARFVPALSGGRATAAVAGERGRSPVAPGAGSPAAPPAAPVFQRPPARALRRYIVPGTVAALLLTVAATLAWPAAWPAIPVVTALAALDGLARYRSAGWRLDSDRLLLRRGALTRHTLVARPAHLQDHSIGQNGFQRRARLANLSITVASGTDSTVAHLDSADAIALFDRLRPV